MSSADSVSMSTQSGRRFHARRRMEGLVYVDLGPNNGALLIDLGEGGLSFQSVAPVSLDQAVLLKFKLPGESNQIEGYAEVAWLNESQKGGGLRFVELSAKALDQIRGWAGVLSPEPSAVPARNGAGANSAQETLTESASAAAPQETIAPEPAETTIVPAEVTETFTMGDSAQPPSPSADETLHAAEAANGFPVETEEDAVSPSPLLEFISELNAAASAAETPAAEFETAPSEAPPITVGADNRAAESSPTDEQDESDDNSMDAAIQPATSAEPISRSAVVPTNAARPEATVILHAAPENRPGTRTTLASQTAARTAGVAQASEFTPRNTNPAAATPPKPARLSATDSSTLAPAQKRQRKPAPPKTESSLPPVHRQDSAVRGSFVRQMPKQAPAATERESPENEPTLQEALRSQALKIGIGALAGACLVLALAAAVPSLRTRLQATASAKSGLSNLVGAPPFQVEVADLNNRRWVLTSGGEAASPFSDSASRETRSNSSRESARSSKSKGSDRSADATDVTAVTDVQDAVETPQPKLPNPSLLALSRPVVKQTDAPSAELLAPSIFDGITPPVGSFGDRLPASGPDVPGIVQPENPGTARPSALQAAVLVRRVAPVYPATALPSRVQGEVTVSATIGKDGVPKNLQAVKGDLRLIPAALAAISQWRYRPATLGGEPVETQTVVTVSFELK